MTNAMNAMTTTPPALSVSCGQTYDRVYGLPRIEVETTRRTLPGERSADDVLTCGLEEAEPLMVDVRIELFDKSVDVSRVGWRNVNEPRSRILHRPILG